MMAKLKALLDKGQTALVVKLMETVHPKVLAVIDGRVDVYRDATIEALPRKCEDGLKEQAGSSSVAWLVDKVLGDDTDVLVEKLLEHFKPGVVSATDGLSASAADTIMAKLRQWLEGSDEQIAAAGAAAAAGGGEACQSADDAAAGVEALQVSSDNGEHHASLRTAARSAASAVLFGLDSQLPAFEEQARALVHPLFEKLKGEVWELVPHVVQETLAGLVGQRDDVDEAAVDGDDSKLGAWLSKVSTKLQGKAGHLVDKVAAITLDAVDGPMQELIARLVDELESSSTAAALKEIRDKLAEYRLISPEAADAAAAKSSPVDV